MAQLKVNKWIHYVSTHYTMYPLLHATANTSTLRLDDVEYQSKMLSSRSNVVLAGLLAIIGFICTTTSNTLEQSYNPPRLLLALIALIWAITNRAYYENLPVEDFQRRVQESTPELVAVFYIIPELYQIGFISFEAFKIGRRHTPAYTVIAVLVTFLVSRKARTTQVRKAGAY
ncbi:hypothetical protein DL96DRAFT_1565019 [Flagelloscypha sp. PMI_526]|nr:hypothetical protein DL96DRAFT_1565019 [Flagelloscypha sp. PMI_526]